MNPADYDKCATRIVDALQLSHGERVLLKLDRRVFGPLVPPLQNLILASGAHIAGVILAEDTNDDLDALRRLFNDADAFTWLPEVHQGNSGALAVAVKEWLDARR